MKVFPVLGQKNLFKEESIRFIICIEVNTKCKKQTYYYKNRRDKFYIKENFYVLEKNNLVLKEKEEIYHLVMSKLENQTNKRNNVVRTNFVLDTGILEKENRL